MEQPSIRSAHELMTLITHEQNLIVNRLRSGDVEGIHEFIMEHALRSRKYYMELIVLMGREDATHKWNAILHHVYGLNDDDKKSLSEFELPDYATMTSLHDKGSSSFTVTSARAGRCEDE